MTALTTVSAEEVLTGTPPLEPGAQCDATASGTEVAVIRLVNEQGQTLDFCAHHFAQHEVALLGVAGYAIVYDNRAVLTQNYRGQAGE